MGGYWLRKWVVGGCLLLHGLRMAIGSLVMFYPYRWKEDLPRYRYAKVRFEGQDGMDPRLWPFKVQHDTLQQAFANITLLACPVMLCAFDKTEAISPLEIAGWALWLLSFAWENMADLQKDCFLRTCKQLRREATDDAAKEQLKSSVLGHAPFDGKEYSLWTRCRHPNYFGEWMCWNGFILSAIPSLVRLDEPLLTKFGLAVALFFVSRTFYDCLNYWTGAEPAEFFSSQKRPAYRDYQKRVRVFFPFEMPLVDHCRMAGWPQAGQAELKKA